MIGGMRNPLAPIEILTLPKHDLHGFAFKTDCPTCQATLVVMDAKQRMQPSAVPPMPGDVVRCDYCDAYCRVEDVQGNKVITISLDAYNARLRRMVGKAARTAS